MVRRWKKCDEELGEIWRRSGGEVYERWWRVKEGWWSGEGEVVERWKKDGG